MLESPHWKKLAESGAKLQRLLLASTRVKDPTAEDTLYVSALAVPDTINTITDKTLRAFAEHSQLHGVMPVESEETEVMLAKITAAGINIGELAARLQKEGAASFVKSWTGMLKQIADKAEVPESSA